MSFTVVHESRRARHACQRCRDRKARFSYRGEVRADQDHTLCFECFRSERERQRARGLAGAAMGPPLSGPFEGTEHPALSARQVAHRQAMLAHCARNKQERRDY
jgi:hypothetical protein